MFYETWTDITTKIIIYQQYLFFDFQCYMYKLCYLSSITFFAKKSLSHTDNVIFHALQLRSGSSFKMNNFWTISHYLFKKT